MFGIETELAITFTAFAERRDSRLAELARKFDTDTLPAEELTEMMDRLDEVWKAFIEARRELGVDTPDLIWR